MSDKGFMGPREKQTFCSVVKQNSNTKFNTQDVLMHLDFS